MRFEAAEAELARFERFCSGRPFDEQDALEAGYGDRSDAMYDALRRLLLRVRAPDLPALGRKIALAVDHEVGSFDWALDRLDPCSG